MKRAPIERSVQKKAHFHSNSFICNQHSFFLLLLFLISLCAVFWIRCSVDCVVVTLTHSVNDVVIIVVFVVAMLAISILWVNELPRNAFGMSHFIQFDFHSPFLSWELFLFSYLLIIFVCFCWRFQKITTDDARRKIWWREKANKNELKWTHNQNVVSFGRTLCRSVCVMLECGQNC